MLLDFQMERTDGSAALEEIKAPLEDAFRAVVSGEAENDGFNRLVIRAGLHWRDVTILRAVAKYLRQTAVQFSQTTWIRPWRGTPTSHGSWPSFSTPRTIPRTTSG